MGTAIKHPVPDRVKPSFVIVMVVPFQIRRTRRSCGAVRGTSSLWSSWGSSRDRPRRPASVDRTTHNVT